MSNKLLGIGDIIVLRTDTVRGIWIPPAEIKEVLQLVGEVSYTLYTCYRTFPFKESDEITDDSIGQVLGWPERKVQRYRKRLESSNLLCSHRYGSKTDGVTKLFVGIEPVALFNAGLPADVINPSALSKLKKEFKVTNSQELLAKVNLMCLAYEQDPYKYK